MIVVNEYFGGSVKSLGYNSKDGKSTIGVMDDGTYRFDTSSHEIVTVIEGELSVLQPGEQSWSSYKNGESFEVKANVSFNVKSTGQTSYLCLYR